MDVDLAQLRALSAAVSEGTLEAAARALHLTPSAVSQRLRALEVATGRVLLVRSRPVQATESGQVLLRLAEQIDLLTSDAAAELDESPGTGPRTLPIAVNADSLATWVLTALAGVTGSVCFDLRREDQERTAALLRSGTVMAAITASTDPVPGCSSTRLGRMRYRPMAAPDRARQWFPGGADAEALAAAPVVVFDRDDDLQHRYLLARSGDGSGLPRTAGYERPPTHYVPSSADFLVAVRLGLGWGMLPDLQSAEHEVRGELVEIDPDGALDVVLHWQQWKLRSPALDRVKAAVLEAAGVHLLP